MVIDKKINIDRSPYTFTVENSSLKLTLRTDEVLSGSMVWPTYENEDDGKVYLQPLCELQIPSGIHVIKVLLDTHLNGQHVANCLISNADTGVVWLNTRYNTSLQYPYIAVPENKRIKLQTDIATYIEDNNDTKHLTFYWSYNINKANITVDDSDITKYPEEVEED